MTVYIRFFCVSTLLYCSLHASEQSFRADKIELNFVPGQAVHYESRTALQSEWIFDKQPVALTAVQDFKGKLLLDLDQQRDSQYPISMQFALDELQYLMREGDKQSVHSLEMPGQVVVLSQLKPWKKRYLPFQLITNFPYVSYSEEFLRKYGGLKVFREPVFASLLGEELYTLFKISDRTLVPGEGFEIYYDISDQQPFQMKKIIVIQSITPTTIVAEITTLVERQKMIFSGIDIGVVDGQYKAQWTIDRNSSLLFDVKETATLTQSLRVNGVDATLKHTLNKHIHTSPVNEQ